MTSTGWICPKCESVYSPFWHECDRCNNKKEKTMAELYAEDSNACRHGKDKKYKCDICKQE